MNETEIKQLEMENYFFELMKVILADGKTGMVPTLKPQFVSCSFIEKSLTLKFKVADWMINPEKIMFGGAMVSMLDNAYGFLGHYFAGDNFISTISLNTTFLKPAFLGDEIHVKIKAESVGRTILNMSGEVHDITTESYIGTSQTTFMILDKKVKL